MDDAPGATATQAAASPPARHRGSQLVHGLDLRVEHRPVIDAPPVLNGDPGAGRGSQRAAHHLPGLALAGPPALRLAASVASARPKALATICPATSRRTSGSSSLETSWATDGANAPALTASCAAHGRSRRTRARETVAPVRCRASTSRCGSAACGTPGPDRSGAGDPDRPPRSPRRRSRPPGPPAIGSRTTGAIRCPGQPDRRPPPPRGGRAPRRPPTTPA
jgi:hypothetical protein